MKKCHKCGKASAHAVHLDGALVASCDECKIVVRTEHYFHEGRRKFARYETTESGWALVASDGSARGTGTTQFAAREDFMRNIGVTP